MDLQEKSAAKAGAKVDVEPPSRVKLRRGQRVAFDSISSEDVMSIECGTLVVHSPRPGGGSRVSLLLFPGDVIVQEAVPPIGVSHLVATTPAELRRMRLEGDAAVAVSNGMARLVARLAIHALMLRELNAEQRLATFLIELALRGGRPTPAGCAFELPFSRTDIACYLALNPDTLSRLMSRLRSQELLKMPSRGVVTVPSLGALAGLTPMVSAIRKLSPAAECGAVLDPAPA